MPEAPERISLSSAGIKGSMLLVDSSQDLTEDERLDAALQLMCCLLSVVLDGITCRSMHVTESKKRSIMKRKKTKKTCWYSELSACFDDY